jgi:hypothetical protein
MVCPECEWLSHALDRAVAEFIDAAGAPHKRAFLKRGKCHAD